MSLSLSNVFSQLIRLIPQSENAQTCIEREIAKYKNEAEQKIAGVFSDFKEVKSANTSTGKNQIVAKSSLPNDVTTTKNIKTRALDVFSSNEEVQIKRGGTTSFLKVEKDGFTELHRACDKGESYKVSQLIEQGFDLEDSSNIYRQTPLLTALLAGNRNCVDQLIEARANLFVKDSYGFTVLHIAARYDWSDVVYKLMKKGLNPYDKDNIFEVSPLFYALHNGNKECVETFLRYGLGKDDVDNKGYTVLHWACKHGWKDVVELCLELGFELEKKNSDDKTPLLVALDTDDRCAQLLIERGANVDAVDKLGFSPLHIVSWNNSLNTAILLISRGANLNHIASNGDTPLITAIKLGREQYAKILVEHGVNIELQDSDDCSALHLACECNFPETVSLLLQNGAISDVRNKFGQTPLDIAKLNELNEIETIFANPIVVTPKHFVQLTELQTAALVGDEETIRKLLSKVIDVNEQSEKGWSALHYACKGRHKQIVEMLTTYGANPNLKNDNGETALHIAFRERDKDSVFLLIKHGANVNERGEDGFLPIHFSCGFGWKDVTKAIINIGTDIEDTENKLSLSPLFFALKNGNKACTKLLINKNVALDVRDINGFTPIHFTCREGWLDIIRLLVEKKVDLNDNRNNQLSTPLFAAISKNHKECVKFLIQWNAKLNIPCNKEYSYPIHMICQRGWHDILRLMMFCGARIDLLDDRCSSPLSMATKFGHEKCAKILIENKAIINTYDKEMNTPLHYACKNNLTKIVRMFVNKFVAVRKNKYEESPVYYALMNQSKECLKFFMHDANYAEKDGLGRTMLHIACMNGWSDMVEQITKANKKLDTLDDHGNTALILALKNAHRECSRILIERGAGINTPDENGYVPLHYLCMSGWNDLLRLILKKKVFVNYNINKFKMSPIFLTIQQGNMKFTKLLLENGAMIEICNSVGYTPLHLACVLKQHEIVELILSKDEDPNYKGESKTTPLHCAVEAGDVISIHHLLNKGADVNEVDSNGNTPLKIAQNLNNSNAIDILSRYI